MISERRVLAVIPARGGSKGVLRKNIRLLNGKPLIGWTIDAAKQSKYIDRVIVSTDDMEIIEVARSLGGEVPFVRPPELARDDTPGIAPLLHALEMIRGYEYVVLLQPTSPLRTSEDIDGCIEMMRTLHAPSCVSIVASQHSPFWMYTVESNHTMTPVLNAQNPVLRRQDSPEIYMLNGAVYVAHVQWLLASKTFLSSATVGFPMPTERSLDIDTELDLIITEHVMRQSERQRNKVSP